MKKVNNKFKILIIAIILLLISAMFIIINGNTYIVKIDNMNEITSIEDLDIKIEDENVVKCVDKSLENGTLKIKLESVSKGKTYVDIDSNEEYSTFFPIYVHNFGVITFNEYMGDSNGSIIIPISIIVFSIYVLYLLIVSYKKKKKENMYQYKNIAYLGIIIFIIISIISQLLALSNYKGLISTINAILSLFSFTTFLLPIAFVVSILVIISNISLIRKEGFGVRNILGILLGIVLCFSSILPEILYNMLYSSNWIDIHNQNGIGVYIYNLVETSIFISTTYIECILIGTVIMSIKAAKHIPQFDKDCIIILGCQIKKDGTLTKLLKERVDRAIEFSKMQKEKTGKDIIFVPSGGKGNDEVISEAQAMKNYLMEQGIEEGNILIEDKSKNTFENIKFSNNIINENVKNAKIAFSTTNYHVFRSGIIAKNQNINIEGIGAKTKSYFWVNAFIREFIATLFSEKKKHIAVVCFILVLAIFMISLQYISNIL
ncbi:MAG: YdcF family protein [Clostridia bacterium]|nr:YdcF family protein [Clostridia bacterium]